MTLCSRATAATGHVAPASGFTATANAVLPPAPTDSPDAQIPWSLETEGHLLLEPQELSSFQLDRVGFPIPLSFTNRKTN